MNLYQHLMKPFLFLLISMSIITSCERSQGTSTNHYLSEKTLLNISYGDDSAQRMDIYLPAGRTLTATKAIVLIHGGGWNGGNKSDFNSYVDTFKRRLPDYAIFNINYRLVSNNHLFPTQEKDVKSAIDFITDKAAEFQFDTSRIVLLGASAGGHLALLQAYKYKSPRIKAVIDYFGPTDLTAMYEHPWHPLVTYALQMVTGTTPEDNPELYRQSSPMNFVTSKSTPTLIFHGGSDNVVDVSQSKELHAKLQQVGVVNDLVIYSNERHGWYGRNLTNSFDHVVSFLDKNVQ